jgi:hypothetical protein
MTTLFLHDNGDYLTKDGIGCGGNEEWFANAIGKEALHLFGLYLDATGADNIIRTSKDTETTVVGIHLTDIIGNQPLSTYLGCFDDDTLIAIERNGYSFKGSVPK